MITPTILEARRGGVTRLVIAGGDGLVHNALPAIAETDIPVGLLAQGTGNDLARALGLPTDLDAAVDAALADPVAVDLITLDGGGDIERSGPGSLVATVVTGGFSGRVTARANGLRFPRGQQRYTIATLIELAKLDTVDIELTVDGETHELASSLFAVGNTRYFGGGMAICPDAKPTDGLLDVTVVGPTTKFEFARVLPTVFSGRHVAHPSVTTFRGRRIELRTSADLWGDGELLGNGSGAAAEASRPGHTTLVIASGALLVAGSLDAT